NWHLLNAQRNSERQSSVLSSNTLFGSGTRETQTGSTELSNRNTRHGRNAYRPKSSCDGITEYETQET
ncbi:6149_t:CDS:1, partial [Acaulospora colombiana]